MSRVGTASDDEPGPVTKPFLSTEMASELLWRLYGMEAACTEELPSFCDQNFYVKVAGEKRGHAAEGRFVLKVLNGQDSLQQAGCYAEIMSVLLFLHQGDRVTYPSPVKNLLGGYLNLQKFHRESDGAYGLFLVTLLSYVPGTILSKIPLSNQVLFSVGQAVANLNIKLLEFKGESENLKERAATNKWCLTSVANVRPFLGGVPDVNHRLLATTVLDRFLEDVKPRENDMRKGVIHADVNRDNILVVPLRESTNGNDAFHNFYQSVKTHSVSGIIDFNDMAYECLVYDVAGSLIDVMIGRKDSQPLVAAGNFLSGYTSVLPLTRAEWQCVYVATAARMVQILVLSYEYFRMSGDSDEYIMRIVHSGGWEVLWELWGTPQRKVEALWEEICNISS